MSSFLLFLFCACLSTLAAAAVRPQYELEYAELHFEQFMQQHNKQYVDIHEKQARFQIFKANLEQANRLNEESDNAVFGVTQFSDLTQEEFVNSFTGLIPNSNLTARGCTDINDGQVPNANAPESLDWRQQNVVTRVKNQLKCGSCYSFSTTGNIEGQYAIKHRQLIELSEQQIVDCDRYAQRCKGGFMDSAFVSIIQLGGIETETSYPYVGREQRCQFRPNSVAVKLAGCNSFNIVSQEVLKQLLYKVGPISVALRATNFHLYNRGIMADSICNVGGVNHALLLVGYGTEGGQPYWLIKNSWDTSFGENGYIKVQRGEGATSCGMMNNGFMSSSTVL